MTITTLDETGRESADVQGTAMSDGEAEIVILDPNEMTQGTKIVG